MQLRIWLKDWAGEIISSPFFFFCFFAIYLILAFAPLAVFLTFPNIHWHPIIKFFIQVVWAVVYFNLTIPILLGTRNSERESVE